MEKLKAKVKALHAEAEKNIKIGFSVESEEVSENPELIMALRRYDYVMIKAVSEQSQIGDQGSVDFPEVKFKSETTSITLTVLDKGIHATLTFTTKDADLFDKVVEQHLLEKPVTLSFERGTKLADGEDDADAYDKPTCSKCGNNPIESGEDFCKTCTDSE